MKLSEKNITTLILVSTGLWVVINLLGWSGHHMIGMYLGVILMLIYMILGIANNGIVSKKFLRYPLLIWAITWILSFFLADYYAAKFAGILPTFNILGFHPSFAAVVFLYWVGGMLTLTLGFIIYKDEWLSENDWDKFKAKIQAIEEEQKRGAV